MRNFALVASGIDVSGVALGLAAQPQLWNTHPERNIGPHVGVSDIWIRYNEPKNIGPEFSDSHDPIWYPAYYRLPALRPIIFGLMAKCQATRLGGVLITKIPPGGHVKPHSDNGWHATYYETKIYVPIHSNPRCVNRVEDESVVMAPGEAWFFNNTVEHEVKNEGNTERVMLIVCMRCDG